MNLFACMEEVGPSINYAAIHFHRMRIVLGAFGQGKKAERSWAREVRRRLLRGGDADDQVERPS